jgi:predicted Zn-dependent peptidase
MSLIVAGKFDQEEVMKDIKAQMKNKQFNQRPITNKDYNEPQKVFKTYEKIKMNVEMPKLGYAFKINVSHIKLNPFIRDLYFQMFNTLLFGNASLFKEDVRQKDLAVSFYTSINDVDNYKTLEFFAKTKKAQEFIERIDQELKNISILEEDFNRIKKVWIAAEVAIVDNYELNLDNISDDIQKYGDLIPNKIDIIKSLNKKQLDEMINSLNFNNRTTVIIDR